MRNWFDLAYLQTGISRQRAAYAAIMQMGIFTHLADYTPLLAGTIPLDIDVPGSDLDILCYAPDLEHFANDVSRHYGNAADFSTQKKTINGRETHLTRFSAHGFDFELFAQAVPVQQQNAYIHMVVEHRLLALFPQARDPIRELKRGGLKTEPAFARYFDIPGDPYAALLKLATLSDDALLRRLSR